MQVFGDVFLKKVAVNYQHPVVSGPLLDGLMLLSAVWVVHCPVSVD